MTKLTGLIAAPHTPFDANGEVNYPDCRASDCAGR